MVLTSILNIFWYQIKTGSQHLQMSVTSDVTTVLLSGRHGVESGKKQRRVMKQISGKYARRSADL